MRGNPHIIPRSAHNDIPLEDHSKTAPEALQDHPHNHSNTTTSHESHMSEDHARSRAQEAHGTGPEHDVDESSDRSTKSTLNLPPRNSTNLEPKMSEKPITTSKKRMALWREHVSGAQTCAWHFGESRSVNMLHFTMKVRAAPQRLARAQFWTTSSTMPQREPQDRAARAVCGNEPNLLDFHPKDRIMRAHCFAKKTNGTSNTWHGRFACSTDVNVLCFDGSPFESGKRSLAGAFTSSTESLCPASQSVIVEW